MTYWASKSVQRSRLYRRGEEPRKKREVNIRRLRVYVYFAYMGREKKPSADWAQFLAVGVRDAITCFQFGDDRSRGLGTTEGQSSPFPIDFDGRPYNTLTLRSERVLSPRSLRLRGGGAIEWCQPNSTTIDPGWRGNVAENWLCSVCRRDTCMS